MTKTAETAARCTVVVGARGERCGAPAVRTFLSSDGVTTFAECAAHDIGATAPPSTRRRFTVRGIEVRQDSRRRFLVVAVRPEPYTREVPGDFPQTYVAFAHVVRRSDSIETARKAAAKHECGPGAFAVVLDTATGEEI